MQENVCAAEDSCCKSREASKKKEEGNHRDVRKELHMDLEIKRLQSNRDLWFSK